MKENNTTIIKHLLQTSQEERDEAWEASLLNNIANAKFINSEPQIVEGSDGFPYLSLQISDDGDFVIADKIDDLLVGGTGIAVVSTQNNEEVEWMFTYGDLVNYKLRGEFYTDEEIKESIYQGDDEDEETVYISVASEEYLPSEARSVLAEYFSEMGVEDVKILLLSCEATENMGMIDQLVFNIIPEYFEKEDDFEMLMRYATWFLPRHYLITGMEEDEMPEVFKPL